MKGTANDHAWAAGIIDADGHITIAKKKSGYYSLTVVAAQVGEELPPVIEKLHLLYGGNLWQAKPSMRRQMWHWQVTSSAAERVLRSVLPYLVGKRRQADIGLRYRALVGAPGKRISDETRAAMDACHLEMRTTTNYTTRRDQ